MDKENKVSQPYSLDPVIVAWATRKAAAETMKTGERVSASAVVNDALKRIMLEESTKEDIAHLQKMVKRQILKQK